MNLLMLKVVVTMHAVLPTNKKEMEGPLICTVATRARLTFTVFMLVCIIGGCTVQSKPGHGRS